MAERTEDVQAHWTRPGVLPRIDAALTELGHDPQNLNPEILATLEHLHSGGVGGVATTRRQAQRITLTEDSRVLDVGCGIGGPARYLAHTYGCRVDGIDLTPELIETGRVLTERRCKLADRVVLQVGNAATRCTATSRHAKLRWRRSLGAGAANRSALPLAWLTARFSVLRAIARGRRVRNMVQQIIRGNFLFLFNAKIQRPCPIP
jgi:SAM-dependent methyltransferase